jgi:hypothetical protein
MRYLIICLVVFCFVAPAQAQSSLPGWASSGNPSNDKLLTMPEYGQAAMLSKATGYSCVGKNPFYMGTEKQGANRDVSFWSITCSNSGKQFMIAIAPDTYGSTVVLQCTLMRGHPWTCYEKLPDLR